MLSDISYRVQPNQEAIDSGNCLPIRYTVLDSGVPGVFNLGAIWNCFFGLISRGDGEGLFAYAKACIDVLCPSAVNCGQPLHSVGCSSASIR